VASSKLVNCQFKQLLLMPQIIV